jgi:uncharacterized protein (DUF885 family)
MLTAPLRTVLVALALVACTKPATPVPLADPAPEAARDVSAELAAFFDRVHAEELAADPNRAARLGVPHDETAWTSLSEAHAAEVHAAAERALDELRTRFEGAALSPEDRLSVRLFEIEKARELEGQRWWWHAYRINQMHGTHTMVPSFLMTIHAIDDEASARSWIGRVRGVAPLFEELEAVLRVQEERGILPPAFVYPAVLGAIDRLLTGEPFGDGPPSPLLAHFDGRVAALELDPALHAELRAEAVAALVEALGPAYRSLADALQAQSPTEDDGVWKLPDGEAYYAYCLRVATTTSMAPEEIHALGEAEVARIQAEMVTLMPALGVEGGLPELFAHLRSAEAYTLPNDDAGRERYLELARGFVEGMAPRLPELFDVLPEAPLEVRRVEPWREGSAGKAFYQRPSLDGSRPGLFYANLRDMAKMPTYQLEALVYHEGIPGHHMQNAVSQELHGLPPFRRFGGYTAYGEGWGLYSERLPKELGMYADPASDVGRLAMELWRAARLVVDTGIHHHRWTRQQAIDYLLENTPNPQGDAVDGIERYIVMPGQATSYKVGMNTLLELRERGREGLGEAFELRDFHSVVLGGGPMPLDVLGEQVDAWIAAGGTP